MLGMPRTATRGYNDWKGRYIKGVVLTTVELIESVGVWREAVLMAQGKMGQRNEFGEVRERERERERVGNEEPQKCVLGT